MQQKKEDLNHVDVDGECTKNILIWANGVFPVSNQQLSVVCQEHSEGNSSNGSVEHVKPIDVFERQDNDRDDTSHEHNNPKNTEQATALGEVNLGLKAKDCDRDADKSGDAQCQEHSFCAIETGYGSSHVGQGQSKERQQNQVPGMLPPGTCAADQHYVDDEVHSI